VRRAISTSVCRFAGSMGRSEVRGQIAEVKSKERRLPYFGMGFKPPQSDL
jgi:hypothetical protein